MTERAQALEAAEPWREQLDRLRQMASPDGDWDLSDNDRAAIQAAIDRAVPPPPPVGSPTTEHEHDYVAVELCRHCLRTEADITGECHHCDEGTGARCWWCFKLKSTPVEPAGMTGQVRLCGALHMDTGAVCELPLDHTENHRGSFSRGIAQWPYESVEPAGASEPPSEAMRQGHYYGNPLEASIEEGRLVIAIGIQTLAHATAFADWANPFDEAADDYIRTFAIEDAPQFAKDVVSAMLSEREDGSTPLSDFLDKMAQVAIEDGSLGLHEDDQRITHGTYAPCETWATAAEGGR